MKERDLTKYKDTPHFKKMVEAGVIRMCHCGCGVPIPRERGHRALYASEKCQVIVKGLQRIERLRNDKTSSYKLMVQREENNRRRRKNTALIRAGLTALLKPRVLNILQVSKDWMQPADILGHFSGDELGFLGSSNKRRLLMIIKDLHADGSVEFRWEMVKHLNRLNRMFVRFLK